MITFYPKQYINNEIQQEKVVISEPFNCVTITDKEEISKLKKWEKEAMSMKIDIEQYINYMYNQEKESAEGLYYE